MNEVWRARCGIVARGCARGRIQSRQRESGYRGLAAVLTANRRRTTSLIRATVQHWSSSQPEAAGPASTSAASSRRWAGANLHFAPPAPAEASAARPPTASARRQRFADIRERRKCRPLAPSSINSAAASQYLLRAGPPGCVQPATIRTPHDTGIPHREPAVTSPQPRH